MDRLMEKLALSKAIMDKADGIKSSNSMNGGLPPTSLQQLNMPETFNTPNVKYNIPSEFLQESEQTQQPYLSNIPRENTKPVGVPTVDAIKNSKLPDEIKRLMIENPIAQPQQQQQSTTISNELIEKASRLMKQGNQNYIPESAKPKQQTQQSQSPASGINYKLIKQMINEAVNEAVTEALHENGLITESSEKSNEIFAFKVGKHVFEGKVTKIKKLS
jgi:hypothetical protein